MIVAFRFTKVCTSTIALVVASAPARNPPSSDPEDLIVHEVLRFSRNEIVEEPDACVWRLLVPFYEKFFSDVDIDRLEEMIPFYDRTTRRFAIS